MARPVAVAAMILSAAGALAVASPHCCPDPVRSPRQDRVAIDAPATRTVGINEPTTKAIGGGLLVVVDGHRLVASEATSATPVFDIDLADIGLEWTDDPAAISIQPYDDGVVLARGSTTTVLARDGTRRWRMTTELDTTRIVEVDRDRIVLVGADPAADERLLVVRTADGRIRFARPIAVLVGVEEQTALVRDAGQDSGVTAVSLVDGAVRWASPVARNDG